MSEDKQNTGRPKGSSKKKDPSKILRDDYNLDVNDENNVEKIEEILKKIHEPKTPNSVSLSAFEKALFSAYVEVTGGSSLSNFFKTSAIQYIKEYEKIAEENAKGKELSKKNNRYVSLSYEKFKKITNLSNEEIDLLIKEKKILSRQIKDTLFLYLDTQDEKIDFIKNISIKTKDILDEDYIRLHISVYSELVGMTEAVINKRIENGQLYAKKINNKIYVYIHKNDSIATFLSAGKLQDDVKTYQKTLITVTQLIQNLAARVEALEDVFNAPVLDDSHLNIKNPHGRSFDKNSNPLNKE